MTNCPGNAPRTRLETICIFCGSRMGTNPVFQRVTAYVGRLLASQGRNIVYGGGHVGLMGVLADAALAAGGDVIGIIPEALDLRELAHAGLTELHIVESMHHRKAMMAERADAFIALPGGLGTYEEIMEAATWTLLGIHDKPLGLLNVHGFYDPLIDQLDRATAEGFLLPEERALVLADTHTESLISQLDNYQRITPPKWMILKES